MRTSQSSNGSAKTLASPLNASQRLLNLLPDGNRYTLLDQLADVKAQSKPLDDAMVVNEPAKPVAGSSKHPNNMDVIDGGLIY